MRTPAASVAPLPVGFRVAMDPKTRVFNGPVLLGGVPARSMRLTQPGRAAWTELCAGEVRSSAAGRLARRLIDAGLMHPRPPRSTEPFDITVIIAVRDRPTLLESCLAALGRDHPVRIVDDGSTDPHAVAEVAERHGALLLRRPQSGGPGAARNSGLAVTRSEFIAFLDSDCEPTPGWIEALAAHFADPVVAAVAPRIEPLYSRTSAGRYARTRSSLDMGDQEAGVVPLTGVAYVPTAALVVRRSALLEVTRNDEVFDPALRFGEDVDLVWRLHEAGWRVRYDPSVRVGHREPDTWGRLLARRFRYGTSAAPLAQRHPGAMAPLVLKPWPVLVFLALLFRRPLMTGIGLGASVITVRKVLLAAGLPANDAVPRALGVVGQTWLGAGRYATQFAAPLLVGGWLAPRPTGRRRSSGRRLAIAALVLGPVLNSWRERRPALGPVRFAVGHIADDVAYGAGVWSGCLQKRTTIPLRPVRARKGSLHG